MAVKIYLSVVEPREGDTNIVLNAPGEPIFEGDEDESLACGACKHVLARNVSARTISEKFQIEGRLVFVCQCGAHNLAPAQG